MAGAVLLNNKMSDLDNAKAKFLSSLSAVDPLVIVRKSPFKSIGAVFSAGLMLGFSGEGISKKLFPARSILGVVLKKLL